MHHVQQNRVEIRKALFKETGTYNDMTLRPYETTFTPHNVDLFMEATNGGQMVAPSTLSGVASEFLRPSADRALEQGVQIDNGWSVARLRFLLEILYYDLNGRPSMRKIIQGYTSHVGVNPSTNSVDPNMVLYFNNVLTLRETTIETPHGTSLRTAVSEANHLVRGDYDMSLGGTSNLTWLMRPEDVFTTMGASILGESDVADLRVSFANSPVRKSKRTNGNASHYVSDIIGGYRSSQDFAGQDALAYDNVMAKAAGEVKESSVVGDKFFHDLQQKSTTFMQGGSVTYGEMRNMFPEFDHVAVIMLQSQLSQNSQPYELHQAGQTERWNNSTNETIWATTLSQSIPSVMMDLMLTRVAFIATNQTLDGQFFVNVGDVGTFAEKLDMTPYVNQFITRLKTEILRGLSMNNQMDFNLTAMVDITGETRISIAIAGGPSIDYATPSFCDALFSPVLTNNQQHIKTLAFDFERLSDNVGVNTVHNHGHSFESAPQGGYHDSII